LGPGPRVPKGPGPVGPQGPGPKGSLRAGRTSNMNRTRKSGPDLRPSSQQPDRTRTSNFTTRPDRTMKSRATNKPTSQLGGCLQATNHLVGCLQTTNQLPGCLQATIEQVGWLQATNQLVGCSKAPTNNWTKQTNLSVSGFPGLRPHYVFQPNVMLSRFGSGCLNLQVHMRWWVGWALGWFRDEPRMFVNWTRPERKGRKLKIWTGLETVIATTAPNQTEQIDKRTELDNENQSNTQASQPASLMAACKPPTSR